MTSIQKRLVFMGVLLVLFLSLYFTFYALDRNLILKETQENEWTCTKVGFLYIFSGTERMHFVSYKDKAGEVHKNRRCLVNMNEVTWRDE